MSLRPLVDPGLAATATDDSCFPSLLILLLILFPSSAIKKRNLWNRKYKTSTCCWSSECPRDCCCCCGGSKFKIRKPNTVPEKRLSPEKVQAGSDPAVTGSDPRPSDEVHEDLVLHDAGHRWHPGLRNCSPLTSRHQDLTCGVRQSRHQGLNQAPWSCAFRVLLACRGRRRLTAKRLPPLALHLGAPSWCLVDKLLPQGLVGHHPLHVGHTGLLRGRRDRK